MGAFVAVASYLTGCLTVSSAVRQGAVSTTGGTPITLPRLPFPTRAEVETILRTRPDPPAPRDAARVDRWTFAGGYPSNLGEQLATTDPSQGLLTGLFGDDVRVVRSAAMRCMAREQGRLVLQLGRLGPSALTQVIRARCGVVGLDVSARFVSVRVATTEPDDRVRQVLIERMRQMPGVALADEPREYGAEFVRSRDQALLVSAWSRPAFAIEPGPRAADASGFVVIAGRAPDGVAEIGANINQGAERAAACIKDPRLALPAFRLRCPLAAGTSATVEVYRRSANALLESPLLAVEMGDPAVFPPEYQRGAAAEEPATVEPRERFVGLLNAARSRVGAAPVTALPRQSAVVCALAPWVVSSGRGEPSSSARDAIALTMVAGWEVPEAIVDAGVATGVALTTDVRGSFDEQFARPALRRLMLEARWNRVAMCPSLDADGLPVAAHWVFYQTLEATSYDRDVARLREAVNARRAQRWLAPTATDDALADIAAAAARRVTTGETEAAAAMDQAMREALRRFNDGTEATRDTRVEAWWVLVPPDDSPQAADTRITAVHRAVGVSVAYVPFPESRWAARVGLVLALEGQAPSASGGTP